MLKSPVEIDLTTILSLIHRRSLPQSLAMVSGDRCSDAMKPARGAVIAAGTGGRACQRRTVAG